MNCYKFSDWDKSPFEDCHSLHEQFQSATRPVPIYAHKGMHENKCLWLRQSPSSFSSWGVGRAGGHVPIDLSLCLCVHPHQPHPIHSHSLPLTSPNYTLPAQIPPFTPSGALYHDVVSFTRGMVAVGVGVGVWTGGWPHICVRLTVNHATPNPTEL